MNSEKRKLEYGEVTKIACGDMNIRVYDTKDAIDDRVIILDKDGRGVVVELPAFAGTSTYTLSPDFHGPTPSPAAAAAASVPAFPEAFVASGAADEPHPTRPAARMHVAIIPANNLFFFITFLPFFAKYNMILCFIHVSSFVIFLN